MRTRSRRDTMPTSFPPSTTGMWRYPCSVRRWKASSTSTSGSTVSGFSVIHSDTLAIEVSVPDAAILIMSRSVRMPTGRASSTTTIEPTLRSPMRALTAAMVSEGVAVSTSAVIRSDTVRLLAPSAMHLSLRGRDGPVRGVYGRLARVIPSELGHQTGDDEGAGDARQPARNHRDLGRCEGSHRPRLGVSQTGAAGDNRDVHTGKPPPKCIRY